MNQSNALHSEEPNKPPRKCTIQTPEAHYKSRTSPPNTSPVVSDIMGGLNNHSIYNGDVDVHPSDLPVEYNPEYVPDPDTTPIK